jgi:hypothetical protein
MSLHFLLSFVFKDKIRPQACVVSDMPGIRSLVLASMSDVSTAERNAAIFTQAEMGFLLVRAGERGGWFLDGLLEGFVVCDLN